MSHLPQPGTTVEIYLAAVYDRLGEILDRLPANAAKEPVELREPLPPVSGRGEGPGAPAHKRPARPAPRAAKQPSRKRKGE